MRRLGTAAVLTAMSMMLPDAGSAQTMAPREAPAKTLPVPTTVSPELQAIIAQPLRAGWDTPPTTKEGWAALVKQLEATVAAGTQPMADRLHVSIQHPQLTE